MRRLIEELFDNSKIKDEDRMDYLVLAEYFEEEKTFKKKHLKSLKKKFEKEKKDLTK